MINKPGRRFGTTGDDGSRPAERIACCGGLLKLKMLIVLPVPLTD